jgi:U3 small nucleolar RNA-associated protein 23
MRHERRKSYKNHLKFFARTFNIRQPYQVICDGNFIHHYISHNLGSDIQELERLIGTVLDTNEFKLYVVDSTIKELQELKEEQTLEVAKKIERLRVGKDSKESLRIAPPLAIKKLIGSRNFRHFIVATQDEELRETLRNVPGVPLLFFQRVLIGLEAPSQASQDFWTAQEQRKLLVPKEERKRLRRMEEKSMVEADQPTVKKPKEITGSTGKKKRKRGKKGNGATEAE